MKNKLLGMVIVFAPFLTGTNCDTAAGQGGDAKSITIPVHLESKGTSYNKQIRYRIERKGKNSDQKTWDYDSPYHGRVWNLTIYVHDGDHVVFHVVNHDDQGTHSHCKITAFKKILSSDLHPNVATCISWIDKPKRH